MQQKQSRKRIVGCPGEAEIELYVLTRNPLDTSYDSIKAHIKECSACRSCFNELTQFYEDLLDSLTQSVSSHVLDLALGTVAHPGNGAFISLKAISTEIPDKSTRYESSLSYYIDGSTAPDILEQLYNRLLAKSDLIIFAFQPRKSDHLLLFLLTDKPQQFSNLKIDFPNLTKSCTTNKCGIAILSDTTLDDIDGQIIETYIDESTVGEPISLIQKLGMILSI